MKDVRGVGEEERVTNCSWMLWMFMNTGGSRLLTSQGSSGRPRSENPGSRTSMMGGSGCRHMRFETLKEVDNNIQCIHDMFQIVQDRFRRIVAIGTIASMLDHKPSELVPWFSLESNLFGLSAVPVSDLNRPERSGLLVVGAKSTLRGRSRTIFWSSSRLASCAD